MQKQYFIVQELDVYYHGADSGCQIDICEDTMPVANPLLHYFTSKEEAETTALNLQINDFFDFHEIYTSDYQMIDCFPDGAKRSYERYEAFFKPYEIDYCASELEDIKTKWLATAKIEDKLALKKLLWEQNTLRFVSFSVPQNTQLTVYFLPQQSAYATITGFPENCHIENRYKNPEIRYIDKLITIFQGETALKNDDDNILRGLAIESLKFPVKIDTTFVQNTTFQTFLEKNTKQFAFDNQKHELKTTETILNHDAATVEALFTLNQALKQPFIEERMVSIPEYFALQKTETDCFLKQKAHILSQKKT